MNTRRLGVALMVVGVVLAATGTFGFGLVDAGRVSPVSAIADDADQEDANYVDTGDATDDFTTIDSSNTTTIWYVFNHFHEAVVGVQVDVVEVEPVNSSESGTTTNDDAVVVVASDFDEGDSISVDSKGRISLTCNPNLNETVNADHHVTTRIEVESDTTGTWFGMNRTVTEKVECNV